ncbi:MAG: pyridoxal-phosphate dependent enzyme [Candidatus Thorarchaeota archaeon]
MKKRIICNNCHVELNNLQRSHVCPQCSTNDVEFDCSLDSEPFRIRNNEQGIWRFKDVLPVFETRFSLGEGNTPLRKTSNLFKGKVEIFLKIEGNNPTGSYLDRLSPLMISDALGRKMNSMVCASDGNLGASLSAYCASAGLKSVCIVPRSSTPEKKVQMEAYGAEIIDFGETIDDSVELAKKMADQKRYQATPEFNLLTIEGSKIISYELIEQLTSSNDWIDYLVIPMGSGRLLYSIWKGFKEAKKIGFLKKSIPKIIGVQVKGYDSITTAIQAGEDEPKLAKKESTSSRSLADAILTRKSIFGIKAIQSITDSNGTSISVSEKQILQGSKNLGQAEGVFAELSSATVIAGIDQLLVDGYFNKDDKVFALITSSGLKTSQAFQKNTAREKKVESFRSMGTKVEILEIIQSSEANFGYGIWKALGQSLTLQAVYQHLKELQNGQHIQEIISSDRQKRYDLTEKGKKLIQKMKELEELLP